MVNNKEQCLQCQKNPIQEEWIHFCNKSCTQRWLSENVNSFCIVSSDRKEKGTKCKHCSQKIGNQGGEIDVEYISELVNHVVECIKNKEDNNDLKIVGKYAEESGGIIIKKNASELTKWYELEKILHKAHKKSGGKEGEWRGNWDQWKKITGVGRDFGCFIREVEATIKQLGGEIYKDRREEELPPNDDNHSKVCKRCQEAIETVKDWEINHKKHFAESCSEGSHYSMLSGVVLPSDRLIHNKCWKMIWKNSYGDIEPCGCSNVTSQELLEFTPENALRSYFITKEIKRVSRHLGELKIEYLDGRSENVGEGSKNKAYEIINFLKEHNKTSLDRNDLGITEKDEKNNKPPNKKIKLLIQLEQFYIQNNIKSISRKGNKLIIEFNDKNGPQNVQLDPETEQSVKTFLQSTNKSSLTLQDITTERERERERERESKSGSWTPWIVGGSIFLATIAIIAIIVSVRHKKKK